MTASDWTPPGTPAGPSRRGVSAGHVVLVVLGVVLVVVGGWARSAVAS